MCGRYLSITEDDFGYIKNIVYAATVIITTDANSDIEFIHIQNLIASYKTEGIKFEAKNA
jgi:hypothetical protein